GLPRGVLVGDGPAGSFGGEAELTLLFHGIDLDHYAVDVVRQSFALAFPGITEIEDFVDGAADSAVRVDLETHMAQFLERAPMAIESGVAFREQEVGVVFQAAFGGKLRLQQAERAGGGVARIGKAGEAIFFAAGVEAFEGAAAHDVFAHRAISAGDGLGELAVAIVGGHGESIQFEFGDVTVFGAAEEVADAAVEIAELGFVEGVVEAQQGRAVQHLAESLARFSADALRGRIGGEQFGVFGFQGLEPAHELVILVVGNLRSVEDVVQVFVVPEHLAKLLDLDRGIFHWPLNYNLTRNTEHIPLQPTGILS